MENPVPCIVCGNPLKHVSQSHDSIATNQPDCGLAFSTNGHYGSAIFDPVSDTRMEIAVCDPCLESNWERVRVVRDRHERFVEVVVPPGKKYDESKDDLL